ncbi:MAG TPA: hypothetical protein VH370_10470 [Humisphaera sp.]|nr:hypothetical protein [Humisphaera sp.]
MRSRIMYIEFKGDDALSGPARIGRATFSKTGRSVYYRGKQFQALSGTGFKANYFDAATGAYYWISGCKKRGGDRLYGGLTTIDEDVRLEYWTKIRNLPEQAHIREIQGDGKYGG